MEFCKDWYTNKHKLHAVFCIAGVATLCLLARAYTNLSSNTLTPRDLMKEASRCLKLSIQDSDASTAILHSSEGLAYLKIARRLASDASLEKSTGVVASELERVLLEIIHKKN
jgi:hypothetical protein